MQESHFYIFFNNFPQKFVDPFLQSIVQLLTSKIYFHNKTFQIPLCQLNLSQKREQSFGLEKKTFCLKLLSNIYRNCQFHRIQSLNNSKSMSKADKSRKNAKISTKRRQALIRFVQQEGNTIRYAAHKLNIKPSTAQQIMKKFKETGKVFCKIMTKGKKETSFFNSQSQHKQEQHNNQIPQEECYQNLVPYDQQMVRSQYECLLMQQAILFCRNLQYQSLCFYPTFYQ